MVISKLLTDQTHPKKTQVKSFFYFVCFFVCFIYIKKEFLKKSVNVFYFTFTLSKILPAGQKKPKHSDGTILVHGPYVQHHSYKTKPGPQDTSTGLSGELLIHQQCELLSDQWCAQ